jgi:DinB superfamily
MLTQTLIQAVSKDSAAYLQQISQLTDVQAQWKPNPDAWNVIEITEHLFWAEQGAIFGMWKTLNAIRAGQFERTLESNHKDMPIDEIISLTWKPKEIVPAVAAPRLGGPIGFWIAALAGLQQLLESFGQYIQDDELRLQAHPHPISGAMDFQQRLEFLSFHINRHKEQCANLIEAMQGI